jgi:lipid II:glycine glycyltransferase (peptidoglycan interpeptide bridge formation enzyme)
MRNSSASIEIFIQAVRALKNEYVHKRGLLLRIFPLFYDDEEDAVFNVLKREGFLRVENLMADRTLIMDLNNSLEDIRKGLKQKWRNQLNAAERNNLVVIEGNDDEMFKLFVGVYRQMRERKVLPRVASIDEFWCIHQILPENFKLRVFVCTENEIPCAGAVCSSIGNTGIYLFGATNEIAMKNKASYLVQWKAIDWLKNAGCTKYDLHGINPEKNPGNYLFKSGLCGKNGKDVHFLGVFEACNNDFNYYSVRFGDGLRSCYDKTSGFIRKIRTASP